MRYLFAFLANDEGNPKSILFTGKAGIGKTLFCQKLKLLRDWADNRLFQTQTNLQLPDFKFAYLLTFRNLNLLGDEELTVKEILERCSFLDDQCLRSSMDTFPLEYILDHSEEVLIIIDCFDEYFNQGQDYIAGDYHEENPNCSERKMKIAALCANRKGKKILKQATIMITSRSDESDKLSKIEFDRIAEVTGFSEQQVTEYVERYFVIPTKRKPQKNCSRTHHEERESCQFSLHSCTLRPYVFLLRIHSKEIKKTRRSSCFSE